MNTVTSEAVNMPPLCAIERRLPSAPPVEIEATMRAAWPRFAGQVAGKTIAIGVGSRGVAALDQIVRATVDLVRESGGDPFLVPAMGSHGGATPEGQIEVLSGLGITENSAGCPIRATMETVLLGHTTENVAVHLDRNVAEADGLILINRVKMHTDFHGTHESGLLKMLAIGLGKEHGAKALHDFGVHGIRDLMPDVAQYTLARVNWIAGVATVEDGYHRVAHLELLAKDELISAEQRLLARARELMPRLPVDDIDVLIVERLGKDISGTGMDSNVLGRMRIAGEAEPEAPRIGAVVVLDLTEGTHGNATGIGLADFTTRRLLEKTDLPITMTNILTSGFLERGRFPLIYDTDAQAIDAALMHVLRGKPTPRDEARIICIRDTLTLDKLWVSPAILKDLENSADLISAGAPAPLAFSDGALQRKAPFPAD